MLLNSYRFGLATLPGYRFWRLQVTRFNLLGTAYTTSPGQFSIEEFRVFDAVNVGRPIAAMTDDAAPTPLVATASSNDSSSGGQIWWAFDQSSSTGGWSPDSAVVDAGPYWVQVDLGAGHDVDATYCTITPNAFVNFGADGDLAILDFEVLASNTGVFGGEEVSKFSVTGATTADWLPDVARVFTFP